MVSLASHDLGISWTCLIQVVLVTVMAMLLLLRSDLLPPSPVMPVMRLVIVWLQLLLLVLVAVVAGALHHPRMGYRHLRVGKVPCILQHRHRVTAGGLLHGRRGGGGGRRRDRGRGLGGRGWQFRYAIRGRGSSVVNLYE